MPPALNTKLNTMRFKIKGWKLKAQGSRLLRIKTQGARFKGQGSKDARSLANREQGNNETCVFWSRCGLWIWCYRLALYNSKTLYSLRCCSTLNPCTLVPWINRALSVEGWGLRAEGWWMQAVSCGLRPLLSCCFLFFCLILLQTSCSFFAHCALHAGCWAMDTGHWNTTECAIIVGAKNNFSKPLICYAHSS